MLVLMLLPAVVAAAFVLLRGSHGRGAGIGIRAGWLIIPAAVLQWLTSEGHYPQSVSVETATRIVTAICLVLIGVLCWMNWGGRPRSVKVGLGLAFAGTATNAIPILAYGGMPYSTSAALRSGFSRQELAEGANGHIPIESDHASVLVALSDLVPIPGLMKVVSIGDLALLVGLIVVLVGIAGRRPVGSRATPEPLIAEESEPATANPSRAQVPTSETERG